MNRGSFEEILRGFSVAILHKASSGPLVEVGPCSDVKFALAERWATYEGQTRRHVGFASYSRVEKRGTHNISILEDVYVDVHDASSLTRPDDNHLSEPTFFPGLEAWTHKVVRQTP